METIHLNFKNELFGEQERKSVLGVEGPFSLHAFSKNYLRIRDERNESDFNQNEGLLSISDPIVFTYNSVVLSPRAILYDNNSKVIPESLNTYLDIEKFATKHPCPQLKIENFPQVRKLLKKVLGFSNGSQEETIRIKTKKAPILFFDHYFYNFTHFVLEAFPRLYFIKDKLKDHPIVLPPKKKGSGYDYYQHISPCLEALGINEENCIVLGDKNYAFNELILPSQIKMHPKHTVAAINFLKEFFYSSSFRTSNPKIYISREKSQFRDIANIEAIEEILISKYGFDKIVMEDISFSEKVNIMARSKYLIACDSSAITNSIFMPKGGELLAFRPMEFPNYNVILSALFGHKFNCQVCSYVGADNYWGSGKLYVDQNRLEVNLEAYSLKQKKIMH